MVSIGDLFFSEANGDRMRHRVVHAPRVSVRRQPCESSEPIATLEFGEVVDLYEWDDSHQWRRYYHEDIVLQEMVPGWIFIVHPTLGPLLRPEQEHSTGACKWAGLPGETQLGRAVRERRAGAVSRLLSTGIEPNDVDENGETPLFDAASMGDFHLVATLLAGRADPGLKSASGLSPVDFAKGAEVTALLNVVATKTSTTADKATVTQALDQLPCHLREWCAEKLAESQRRRAESQRRRAFTVRIEESVERVSADAAKEQQSKVRAHSRGRKVSAFTHFAAGA